MNAPAAVSNPKVSKLTSEDKLKGAVDSIINIPNVYECKLEINTENRSKFTQDGYTPNNNYSFAKTALPISGKELENAVASICPNVNGDNPFQTPHQPNDEEQNTNGWVFNLDKYGTDWRKDCGVTIKDVFEQKYTDLYYKLTGEVEARNENVDKDVKAEWLDCKKDVNNNVTKASVNDVYQNIDMYPIHSTPIVGNDVETNKPRLGLNYNFLESMGIHISPPESDKCRSKRKSNKVNGLGSSQRDPYRFEISNISSRNTSLPDVSPIHKPGTVKPMHQRFYQESSNMSSFRSTHTPNVHSFRPYQTPPNSNGRIPIYPKSALVVKTEATSYSDIFTMSATFDTESTPPSCSDVSRTRNNSSSAFAELPDFRNVPKFEFDMNAFRSSSELSDVW